MDQESVDINLKFDSIIEGSDYSFTYRYDAILSAYVISLTFYKVGTYIPQYYFDLQQA